MKLSEYSCVFMKQYAEICNVIIPLTYPSKRPCSNIRYGLFSKKYCSVYLQEFLSASLDMVALLQWFNSQRKEFAPIEASFFLKR